MAPGIVLLLLAVCDGDPLRGDKAHDVIEVESVRAQGRRDKRLIVTIRPHQCVIDG